MAMTPKRMQDQANKITDYYTDLQQRIFYLLIDATKDTRPLLKDSKHTLEWRLLMLSKLGALTDEVVKMVAKTAHVSEHELRQLISDNGLQVAKDINGELSTMLKQQQPISDDVSSIIDSYAHQTLGAIDNNVNQTLLSHNYRQNNAGKMFQDIINQTALEVQTGLKTPERALADNIYKWHDKGIKSSLVDRGGHHWSLEGYVRTVITSTTNRTYNDVRLQSMKDFDTVLATMTAHPAARAACAEIQGHVVNIVPRSDPRFDADFDTIYDHGYGKRSGTLGINCGHMLYPYVKGISHNFQKHYDPTQAEANMKIQQKQRYYERSIRHLKHKLALAEKLNDQSTAQFIKGRIRGYQKKLRVIVKENDFLHRQYSRERAFTGTKEIKKGVQQSEVKLKKDWQQLRQDLGKHGLPKSLSAYRSALYNKDTRDVLHAYVKARKDGQVEPVVTYQDFSNYRAEFNRKIVGMKLSDGTKITELSQHTISRGFGARHDWTNKGLLRKGVSVTEIMDGLTHAKVIPGVDKNNKPVKLIIGNKAKIIVNPDGLVITIMPQ